MPTVAAVERLAVDEDRLVFPLAGLLVLLAVVDREAELGDLAAVGEGPHFGVARQPADQHHLVQVRHVGTLLAVRSPLLKSSAG